MNTLFPRTRLLPMGLTLLLTLPAVSLTGCGRGNKNTLTVSGKVTYKGVPVSGGTISLYPVGSGNFAKGIINADGSFTFASVPPGDKRVAIETESIRGMNMDYAEAAKRNHHPGSAKDAPPKPTDSGVKFRPLPAKYKNPGTSGLSWDVKPGTETKEFNLQ